MRYNTYSRPVISKIDKNGKVIKSLKTWLKTYPNGLYFDSKLEYNCYKYLQTVTELKWEYHPDSITYLESFEALTFTPSKKAKKAIKSRNIKKGDIIPAEFKTEKIRKASYTPDFTIIGNNGEKYITDCKGFADQTFLLRIKFFKSTLKNNEHALIVKSVEELKDLITLILNYEKTK